MIVATIVELRPPTRKCLAEARYISILRPEDETFPNRIACPNRKFRISPRHIIYNHLAWKIIVSTSVELSPPTRKFRSFC